MSSVYRTAPSRRRRTFANSNFKITNKSPQKAIKVTFYSAGPQKPRPKLVAGRTQVNNINVPAVTANVAATETKTSNQKSTVTQNIKTERTTESAALIKLAHETKSNLQSQEIHTNNVKDSRDCPMKYVEKQTRPVFSTGEIHELDPLLSRVLDDEVKNIMIKMWQELPDEASSDLDRYCLDVMRNEIGDSFSRVLGLNVIKRLLNVHNALFVKIRFSCKPNMEALKNFLRKYKIDKFKRIDPTSSIFAAQMNTFEDFDKLCSMKQFQCGEAKVWVTPCYRFTHCPDKIRSLYYEKYFNNKYINKTVPTKVTSGTQSGSEANDSENNKLKVVIKQEPVIEKKVQKVEEKKQDKIEQKDDKIEKKTATVIKKSENKELIKFTENKQLVNKKTGNPQQKTENTQQKIENKVEKLENKQQKVQVQNIVSKITRTIEKQENTEPKQLVKNVNKDSKKSSLVSNLHKENKTNVNVNKKVPKIDIHVYDVLDEIVDEEIPENALEGEEELADEDILALMSEGVVLDECSGSDDE